MSDYFGPIPSNMIKIPMVRQSTTYTCGVAALQSVLAYFGHPIREDLLSKEINCSIENGTPYWEMERYCIDNGLQCNSFLEMTLQQLELNIEKGNPVIVAIQAWSDLSENKPWKDRWDDGHYVVAIGFDEKKLYFMDPSTLGNYTYIEKGEFLERWHDIDQNDNPVIRLGLVISGIPKSNEGPLFTKIN